MDASWARQVDSFAEAAHWFVSTAGTVGDRWGDPGLGEWDVRSLVGHTSRSMLTVEAYLDQPADVVAVGSTAAYYAATRAVAAGPEVAERGRQAGRALGEHPVRAVEEIAARVVPRVRSCTGDEVVTTVAGGMRLADYLPTRTFELIVHTLDLAAALGSRGEPPALPAREALRLVADLAVEGGSAATLLHAATGRALPDRGFSVL